MPTPAALLFALVLLGHSATAQRTLVVRGGGSALTVALGQAAPGDTLDVFPGDYDPAWVSIGVNLLFRPGARILCPSSSGGLSARQIPAGQRLFVRGLRFAGTPLGGTLSIGRCSGTVILDDVDLAPAGGFSSNSLTNNTGPILVRGLFDSRGPRWARLWIQGCHEVAISESPTLPRLEILDSRVLISNSTIPTGGALPCTVRADSDVMLTDVHIEGSAGGSNWFPAALVEHSTLTLTGDTVLTGGPGPSNPRTEAIVAVQARIRLAPSAQLRSLRTDPISGTVQVDQLRMPATTARPVAPGVLEILTRGTPGTLTWTALDVVGTAAATPWGPLWFSPNAVIVATGPLPADGIQTLRIAYPQSATGALVTAQAVTWTGAPTLVTGGATRTLLD